MIPLSILLTAIAVLPCAAANVVLYGPTPYRQRSESPFFAGIQRGTILIEDFEDGLLNTPGVSVTTGAVVKAQGVDEDDGVLNGLGFVYVLLTNTAAPGLPSPFGIEIKFSANPQGQYPNYAGFALLGFIPESSPEVGVQYYQFFDPDGNSITPGPLSSVVPRAPDDTLSASSIGDRFVGAYSDTGIARVIIGATNRFDHLQFGYSIPEPGAWGLAGAGALMLLRWRRRG